MAILDKMKDVGRSITGSPKKAILIFPYVTMDDDTESMDTDIAGKASKMLNTPMEGGDPISLPNKSAPVPNMAQYLEVQYNPASIRYSASSQAVTIPSLQNPMEHNALNPQITRPASVSMQVDLIFNDVNVKDAFMADKMRLSANDIITDTAAVVNDLRGGYTVQPQSNGLIAATFDKLNRIVIFQWADTSFEGELAAVNVKYTMFSVHGRPIHSVVTLRIVQVLKTASAIKYWNQEKFDACFNNKSNRSIGQAAGNLLNISGF